MNYYLKFEFSKLFNKAGKYTATSKARFDVEQILHKYDFTTISIKRHFQNSFIGNLELLLKIIFLRFKFRTGDVVFLQYPIMNLKAFNLCYKSISRAKVIAILHDLPSYRFDNQIVYRDIEVKVLNSFSNLIVHSEQMKKALCAAGVNTNMFVLRMFDYLLDFNVECKKTPNIIVFAGALHKSVFLQKMNLLELSENYNLYGAYNPKLSNKHLNYKGKFSPNDISPIEGEWGLLWDGENVDTCKGQFGKYLKIIAPHKFSLYIASGLKIIAWKESAMASVVLKENIGVVIESINEIHGKLVQLTAQEKRLMETNVLNLSHKLRNGYMLDSVLNKILDK